MAVDVPGSSGDFEGSERALAEAIPVIVWTADASGWIDWYNGRWYEYTGQTPEEAAGWGWQAAHHPEDLPRVMQQWPHSIATGEPFEMEFRLRRADGEYHTMLTRATPVRNGRGEIVRWYGSNVDIQDQKDALERTKRVAETLQGVFLPGDLPHTPHLRVDAVYKAAEKNALIGGDWFDAVEVPGGRLLISIGDVTGHGLDASIIAGRLRQAIFDFTLVEATPGAVLHCVNRVIRCQHPETYASAVVVFIDPAGSSLTYANAGHPPPVLAQRTGEAAMVLPYGGLPLGIEDDLKFMTHNIAVERDAVLALFTDGFTEFSRDVEHAEEQLKLAAARLVGDTSNARPAEAIARDVLGGMSAKDDAALLIVQFSEVVPENMIFDPATLRKTWRFHSSDAYTAHLSRQELMKFIRRHAAEAEDVFTAELILGEILANTVEHAPGLVEVRIDWSAEKPVTVVRDTGPGLTRLLGELPQDAFDENGRGLFLIKALADDVSVKRAGGYGTELRAVLPVRRAPQ